MTKRTAAAGRAAFRARVIEALAGAPDGLSVPEIRAALGAAATASMIRNILLSAVTDGTAYRTVETGRYARSSRRGGRNVPVVVFRAASAVKVRRRRPASEATRRKISDAKMGHPVSPETRQKISEAARARRGRPVTPETRQKISEALRGRHLSPETRARMSASYWARRSAAKGETAS